MPNLTEIQDSDAVDSIYVARSVVYVEADEDSEVYARLLGMKVTQKVDFKAPGGGQGGWMAVCKQVARERQSGNLDVYGLIDGDAASCLGQWRDLVEAKEVIVELRHGRGILCLADHELENLLLRYGGICAYLADDVALNQLSSRTEEDIEQTLRRLTWRFFYAAVLGYAVQHLNYSGKQYPTPAVGQLQMSSVSTGAIRAKLKLGIENVGLDWGYFKKQVYEIMNTLRKRFQREGMSATQRSDHFLRLADGKELLKKMIGHYDANVKIQGHLVQTLIGSDYAEEFRVHVLKIVAKELR